MHVEVDYPADWSVSDQASRLTFNSLSSEKIQLAKIETGGLPPEEFLKENELPNIHCSSRLNGYGIMIRVCLNTISGSYSAGFIVILSQETPQLLSMSTLMKGNLHVFEAMVGLVRLSTHP